jgi:hypothetical protein
MGSSNPRVGSPYSEVAIELGRSIAQKAWTLVCGGANSGLIHAAAQSAQQNSGRVVAVVPQIMIGTPYIYEKADEIIITEDISSRKSRMIALSDVFIVLPGGIGTLDEVFTILALKQYRMLPKPVVLLDINGFLGSLTGFMQWLETETFINPGELSDLCLLETSVEGVMNRLHTLNPVKN